MDKIITARIEPEAVQDDGGNWNNEQMLEAAVEFISLDSDLQSSGSSTHSSSSSDNEGSARSVLNVQGLMPIAPQYRYRSATKRFTALLFAEKCFQST